MGTLRHFTYIRKFFLLILPVFLCLLPPLAGAQPLRVTDEVGRTIILEQNPSRIISLAPSITEILFALGLDREIVGVTEFCDYPPRARQKPSIGGFMNPSLERIVSLEPDLVIVAKEFYRPGFIRELERLDLPVYVSDPSVVESVFSALHQLGGVVGRVSEAETLAHRIRSQMEKIRGVLSDYPRRRVLYVLWHDPLMSVGPGSFVHELIEQAGGQNIVVGNGMAYSRLAMETVIARDPEVIIFPDELGESEIRAQKETWRLRWGMLSAVRQERFYVVDADLVHRPGPRLAQGLLELARVIHPEAYGEEGP